MNKQQIINLVNDISHIKKDSMEKQEYFKKQREAMMNDQPRKYLFDELFKLYANSMPMVLKKGNEDIIVTYSDDVEKSAEMIREQIRLRDKQIFNAFSK